jgi:NitT/TauT family transport system substrate-binding protein
MGSMQTNLAKQASVIITFSALPILVCSEPPEEKLRIGSVVWPGYEPLYLARDLGNFDETNIRLVELSSAAQVVRAYRNGVIEVAAFNYG